MEIKIVKPDLEHLDSIEELANNTSMIVPNSHMIYYLMCTVFRDYSFVAYKENELIGYFFTMPDWRNNLIWLHQLVIAEVFRNQGIGSKFFKAFESIVKENGHFRKFKCAIRPDNFPSKKLAIKFGYKNIKLDKYLNMNIFEKSIILD